MHESIKRFDIQDITKKVEDAVNLLDKNLGTTLPKDRLEGQISDLEREQSDPSFWEESNSSRNKRVTSQLSELTRLRSRINRWEELKADCEAGVDLIRECDADDSELIQTLLTECNEAATSLLEDGERFELEKLLNGKYDSHPTRIIISAGAGGTEACDWVNMLQRMYVRHANNKCFKVTVEEKSPGDEVGYKKITLLVEGSNAYGRHGQGDHQKRSRQPRTGMAHQPR